MAETTNETVADAATTSDTSGKANIAAAETFSPSGAPHQVTDIDLSHPAVDNDPRAGTTVNQNRIDFNDPDLNSSDAVAKSLGMKTAEEALKEQAEVAAAEAAKAKPKA